MTTSPPPRVFRRAAPPAPKAPIPAGQSNTAAHGANGTLRLNKRMAELGLASRREADDWIGKEVILYVDPNVSYGGKVTGGLRLKSAKPASAPKRVVVTRDIDDEDIPL